MVLAMGAEQWSEALPYIQAIHDWTAFLILIQPDKPEEKQPKAPLLKVEIDGSKVIEAQYSVLEVE